MYDNTARLHDPLLMRFASPAPLYAKFGSLSPWSHCAADPLNHFDPDGRILLNDDGSIHLRPTAWPTITLGSQLSENISAVPCRGFTTLGTPITIHVNLTDQKEFDANCHGFTFLHSRGSLQSNADVKAILNDEYQEIQENEVQAGNIVIYEVTPTDDERCRLNISDPLVIAHSAIVESVEGGNITEKSKMGYEKKVNIVSHSDQVQYYNKDREQTIVRYFKRIVPDDTQFSIPNDDIQTNDK